MFLRKKRGRGVMFWGECVTWSHRTKILSKSSNLGLVLMAYQMACLKVHYGGMGVFRCHHALNGMLRPLHVTCVTSVTVGV